MKIGIATALIAMSLCLTGCYNMRTDVTEPIDKCTFGESCEHYLLFAHDCRRTSAECNPICKEDLNKFKDNKLINERNWNRFKNFDPAKYQFRRTKIILFDNINPIIIKLSCQIKYEVVIPYIELDKQGLIATYDMFMEDVKVYQKIHEETYGKKMSLQTACEKTFLMWQQKYGQETCDKLFAVFPVIRSLSANRQILNAVARNAHDAARLLLHLERGIAQLKAKTKNWQGIAHISVAGLVSLNALKDLVWTTNYLAAYQEDKIVLASHVESYLRQFNTRSL